MNLLFLRHSYHRMLHLLTYSSLILYASTTTYALVARTSNPSIPSIPSIPSSIRPSYNWNWKGYNVRYTKAIESSTTTTTKKKQLFPYNIFNQVFPKQQQQQQVLPPIILIHGFGASYDYYRKQIPVFASAGHAVYAIDLLGFGGSDKALTPFGTGYSVDLWAEQILDFYQEIVLADELALALAGGISSPMKPILAGNSIGSRIALQAALKAPDLIRGLLLYNTAAGINTKFILTDKLTPFSAKFFAIPIFTLLDNLLKNKQFSTYLFNNIRKPDTIRSILQSLYINKFACDDELVNAITIPANDTNAKSVFVQILTANAGNTPDTFMTEITCPIQFIWGEFDTFTPLNDAYGMYYRKLSENNKNITFNIVNGGHCPHDDCHDECNQVALNWLKSIC